ncbi:MAG TPA: J domain-containing protein [Umezawaea sp.]|nr:J domain-containing protein [Umezawaea sp.]
MAGRRRPPPDPHAVLGVPRDATTERVTEAYRALVRALHPDTGDTPEAAARLVEVLAAYASLRDRSRQSGRTAEHPEHESGPTPIPVRVHRRPPRQEPDLRVGPVRRHPG